MVLLFDSVDGFMTVHHDKFHVPNNSDTSVIKPYYVATVLLDLTFWRKIAEVYLNFLTLQTK
jgi:hypothetical protein